MKHARDKITPSTAPVESKHNADTLEELESEESDEYTDSSSNEQSTDGSEHETDDEIEPTAKQLTNPNNFFVRIPPRPINPPTYQEALQALELKRLRQLKEDAVIKNLQDSEGEDTAISCLPWF